MYGKPFVHGENVKDDVKENTKQRQKRSIIAASEEEEELKNEQLAAPKVKTSPILNQLVMKLNIKAVIANYTNKKHANLPIFITFYYKLDEELIERVRAVLIGSVLYVEVPLSGRTHGVMSKEFFISILEYAEEELACLNVVTAFSGKREDKNVLCRMFNFMGFELLPEGDVRYPLQLADGGGDNSVVNNKSASFTEDVSREKDLVLWNYEV